MIYAFDTFYSDGKARTVCIGFPDWSSTEPTLVLQEILDTPDEYVSGEFYRRELPGILHLLQHIDLASGDILIVDGFVFLNDEGKPGLGARLFEALEGKFPVIGVAKTDFRSIQGLKKPVHRGESKKPLFITAAGIDLDQAAAGVENMAGGYRIPDMLKRVDLLSKQVI